MKKRWLNSDSIAQGLQVMIAIKDFMLRFQKMPFIDMNLDIGAKNPMS